MTAATEVKTVLHLICEFGALNDAMMRTGGSLPPEDEKRWKELRSFYQVLMSRDGLQLERELPPVSAAEIREMVGDRERLRVPVNLPIVFQREREFHTGRLVNLSRGGAYLASEYLFEPGDSLLLYLSNMGSYIKDLFETKAEVVWITKRGVPEVDLPRGMGVQFIDFPSEAEEMLDAYVVETIATQLSRLW